ncbi:hypothetical protein K461DRAFT_115891 [Myriangium duriaei CBS 260.36]|uniref:Transcription factor TFIIIC complex subunit Tfc6 n=1 Tax=Myriangium duriaei CBS 260.36 TaxID=1168546 RepID=A0A9P4J1I9_9PEZI|nr:hypothetical protein K461DRAFT_115891 [Myriangium duriaei CBS 260.36]
MADFNVRKSTRTREPPSRFNQDAVAELELLDEELLAEEGEIQGVVQGDDDDDLPEDFIAGGLVPNPYQVPAGASADDDFDNELDHGDMDEDYEDEEFESLNEDKRSKGRDRTGTRWPTANPASGTLVYSRSRYARGLLDPKMRTSKEAIRRSVYGPDLADQSPAIQSLYRWRKERVLPSRKADRSGAGGYHRTFYQSDAQRNTEMTQDWTWYDEATGREALKRLQIYDDIDSNTAKEYLPTNKMDQEVIMGPYEDQRSFKIPYGSALDLNEPFADHIKDLPPKAQNACKRSGWLLNLGQRVQGIAWAPNQGGTEQYLAVITLPLRNPTEPLPGSDGQTRSSFRPQPPTKAAIQIWQFNVGEEAFIDHSHPPRLRQVICTDWGDPKVLKWCMVPRKYEPEDSTGKHLGLLAGVWSDGAIRVLDVTLPLSTTPTHYTHLRTAAFSALPPSGVFTSLTWLSSHSICGGTSSGSAAILSLSTHLSSPSPLANANPLIYSPLQSSYIIALTTCYPSRPHMLASTSVAGCISLTDLSRLSPATGFTPSNTVLGPRTRIARSSLVWHDWSQTLLSCDENATLHALPLRRFFGYTGLTRFRSGVGALAVSECHPFVAAGGNGGEVTTANVMHRAMSTKEGTWNMRWFRHEWQRKGGVKVQLKGLRGQNMAGLGADAASMEWQKDDGEKERSVSDKNVEGVVRITEGYRAESILLLKDHESLPKGINAIHEAQSAATAVAWNPNLHVGGWIAAGMASGLLRIEDVGVDAQFK